MRSGIERKRLLEEMQIKLDSVISDLLGVSGRLILLRGNPTPTHISMLKLYWEHVELMDRQIEDLDRLVAQALKPYEEAVQRLAEVSGFGVDTAQQLIAEVGVLADAFPSAGQFSSWVGTCPGSNVTAEENHSSRSPKGNKFARRLLNQAANAAIKKKGLTSRTYSAVLLASSAIRVPSGWSLTDLADWSG